MGKNKSRDRREPQSRTATDPAREPAKGTTEQVAPSGANPKMERKHQAKRFGHN
ncbi:hypothetical protein QNO07_11830 [Streptomyces sp. 549]|uniref:hypothetical protein n=1 Tax=Streptomyces sp. 549 TaxID=3049076 RepID=UPI0024C3F352|nr:hypothetical protein [Streptomyces sp. 549]MDK1474096.1 hypothetical protein [Streptomyces sp. 549]